MNCLRQSACGGPHAYFIGVMMNITEPDSAVEAIHDAGLLTDNMTIRKQQGYEPVGKFGMRAGPELSIAHLAHELSHGILHVEEGEHWRLDVYGYGLSVTEVEVLGRICQEPTTGQATARESRVVGTQIRLLEVLGREVDPVSFADDFANTLHNFMPDWVHYVRDKQRIARMILSHYEKTSEQTIRRGWEQLTQRLGELHDEN